MAPFRKLLGALLEDTSTSRNKFAILDGLRGVAVLIVFFSHTSGFKQRLRPDVDFHGTGHLGVYLFFVLSGFLLTHALLRRPIDGPVLAAFWQRRFFRIAPLYYSVLAVVFGYQLWAGKYYAPNQATIYLYIAEGWAGFFKHLAFLKGNTVFWTIAAEFEFYFILPLLVWLLIRYGGRAAIGMTVFAVAYCAWSLLIVFKYLPPQYALKIADITHTTQFFDVFICGTLAAWLYNQEGVRGWWARHRGAMDAAGMLVGTATLVVTLALVADRFFLFHRAWPRLRDFSLLYGASFAFVMMCSLLGGRFPGVLFQPLWLRLVGIVGFSWYLLHFPVMNLVNALTDGNRFDHEPLKFFLSLIGCIVVSVTSYLLIEKPFMMASRNVVRRAEAPPAPAAE